MYVNLYSTADDPRTVNKQLNVVASNIPCKPAEPCSLITPQILLDYSSTYLTSNYIYISDFDCYYFAVPTLETGREMRLACNLDPLMSYNLDDIEILAIRSESEGINYIVDPQLPINPSIYRYDGKDLGASPITNTKQILLITNGGT